MNYDYYRIFYYVARRRSFTGAAEALGSSQPNVTRCMNNLEFELGCKLFERSNRGVKLTPEGAALYERVRAAQQQLEAAERELEQRKCLERGEISVGASETALHLALLPALKKFRRSHPQIRVRVANYSTPQAVAALRRGEVELALATTPTGAEPPLSETALSCFQEILVGGPLYAELAGRILSLGDLRDAINKAAAGVSAVIVTGADNKQNLVLTTTDTGTANAITLSGDASFVNPAGGSAIAASSAFNTTQAAECRDSQLASV